jgi:ATP-dependent exoDNAse (exonuclease V) alpha subunit
MNFPIARNQYSAKKAEISHALSRVDILKKIQLLELKTDLKTILNSLNLIIKNFHNAKEETQLLLQLQGLEKKKFTLGSSTLFTLNQREVRTIEAEVTLLNYKLQYHLLLQTYKKIIGIQKDIL